MTRWELGLFNFVLLFVLSVCGGVFLWVGLVKAWQVVGRRNDPTGLGPIQFAQIASTSLVVWVGILLFSPMRGQPVGGLVVLDSEGRPQRALVQTIVTTNRNMAVQQVMVRSLGPGGATRGVRWLSYENGRSPLTREPAFWRDDTLFDAETLLRIATGTQVRAAVNDLRGIESRLLHVKGGQTAVFERRDGRKVEVRPSDVIEGAAPLPGCFFDRTSMRSSRATDLIDPEIVGWASGAPGCPRQSPGPDVELLVSDDAAFGDVRRLVTLQESGTTRWQAPLEDLIGGWDPELLGAVPLENCIVLISGDGDDLVFARVRWDGTPIDSERW
jgi:hypothetical protein